MSTLGCVDFRFTYFHSLKPQLLYDKMRLSLRVKKNSLNCVRKGNEDLSTFDFGF